MAQTLKNLPHSTRNSAIARRNSGFPPFSKCLDQSFEPKRIPFLLLIHYRNRKVLGRVAVRPERGYTGIRKPRGRRCAFTYIRQLLKLWGTSD